MTADRDAAWQELAEYLNELWIAAGCPSTREIADDPTVQFSHSSVHGVIRLKGLPGLDLVLAVGRYLDGDSVRLRSLWTAAKASNYRPQATPVPHQLLTTLDAMNRTLNRMNMILARIDDRLDRTAT